MIYSGLVSATFKTLDWKDVLSLVREAGLKGIEWSENHHVALGDSKKAKEMGDRTRDEGIEVVEYGSYYRLLGSLPFEPSLENAKAMKAPLIRVWAGEKGSKDVTSSEREALLEDARRISRLSRDEGIDIAFEWHKNTLTDSNLSALSLLDELSGEAYTLWQPNYLMSDEERLNGLISVNTYLKNLHAFHWDKTGRRPLSEGVQEWKSYFGVLDDSERYALIEFVMNDSVDQFREDASTLKRLLGEK